MIRIYFVRHGATAGNLERRYIGVTDEALSKIGEQQLLEVKKQNIMPDRVFVSPRLRAIQTAQLLFPNHEHQICDGLAETDFGIFEAKTADELSNVKEYQAWLDTMCLGPIPGGESVSEFKKRCCTAFEVLLENTADKTVLALVTHGGVIMAILEKYARPQRDFYAYHIAPGTMLCCEYDGVLKLSDCEETGK